MIISVIPILSDTESSGPLKHARASVKREQAVDKKNRFLSSYMEETCLEIPFQSNLHSRLIPRQAKDWWKRSEERIPSTYLTIRRGCCYCFSSKQEIGSVTSIRVGLLNPCTGRLWYDSTPSFNMGGPWYSLCLWTCVVCGWIFFPSRIAEAEIRRGPVVVRHDWPVSRLPDRSARVRLAGKRRQGSLLSDPAGGIIGKRALFSESRFRVQNVNGTFSEKFTFLNFKIYFKK